MMKIYMVKVSSNSIEYQLFCDNINLLELNRELKLINPELPLLNNNDIVIFRTGGGTVIYNQPNYDTYLIDLDFILSDQYRVFDSYLYDKFDNYRKIIKREMKLNSIIE